MFADVLADAGIEYDYTVSNSPADHAESAHAVFIGRLTGNVTFRVPRRR